MAVVLAVAVGIALGELWRRGLAAELPAYPILPPRTLSRTLFAGRAASVLISSTLAVTLLRLRPPRPRLWLLARQPGAIACLAATLALVVEALSLPLGLRTMGGLTSPLLVAAWYWPTGLCAAVLASWLHLALSRRWRTGDWVDRLGMLLGVGWIGLLPLLCVVEFL
jgi:hypothetical protein